MALLTKNDMVNYVPMSKSANILLVNMCIERAEIEYVLPLIGERFFNKIVADTKSYASVLDPHTYTHEGNTYTHKGLRYVIAFFAYSFYLVEQALTDTAFGVVQKTNEFSTPIPSNILRQTSESYQHTAQKYWELLRAYLKRNESAFSEFIADTLPNNNHASIHLSVIK